MSENRSIDSIASQSISIFNSLVQLMRKMNYKNKAWKLFNKNNFSLREKFFKIKLLKIYYNNNLLKELLKVLLLAKVFSLICKAIRISPRNRFKEN
jgi:hypothetical protein